MEAHGRISQEIIMGNIRGWVRGWWIAHGEEWRRLHAPSRELRKWAHLTLSAWHAHQEVAAIGRRVGGSGSLEVWMQSAKRGGHWRVPGGVRRNQSVHGRARRVRQSKRYARTEICDCGPTLSRPLWGVAQGLPPLTIRRPKSERKISF